MTAAAAAAMTTAQMILLGENHFSIGVEIKIPDTHRLRHLALVKFCDAPGADAGAVVERFRHLRQQFRRHFHLGTPARAFVGGGRTELATIRFAAERTQGRI